jgi:hypothetical protein
MLVSTRNEAGFGGRGGAKRSPDLIRLRTDILNVALGDFAAYGVTASAINTCRLNFVAFPGTGLRSSQGWAKMT